MKKIGIIGGLGPDSTVDYYRGIIGAFKSSYKTKGYPEIVISSLNLKEIVALAEADKWSEITEVIGDECEKLRLAGAQFGAIATNTIHRVFDEIGVKTKLPLVSIVTATLDATLDMGLRKVGLLGTIFTMDSDFYRDKFEASGVKIVLPNRGEMKYIQNKLFSEIEHGIIKEATKEGLLAIVERLSIEDGIDGVILGCTELPLIIKKKDVSVPCLDTTQIHISRIVETCRL